MKTSTAINFAGSSKTLAELLDIHPSAVSQWGDDIPAGRVWQLKVLRPMWFEGEPQEVELTKLSTPSP